MARLLGNGELLPRGGRQQERVCERLRAIGMRSLGSEWKRNLAFNLVGGKGGEGILEGASGQLTDIVLSFPGPGVIHAP